MNSLQHSLTRKLPWRERLNLQTQPHKLGMSALTPVYKICCKSRIVVFITSVCSMARTASRTSVLLVRSTVRTWGLPMNVSAYGCWEEIWGPTCLDGNLIMFWLSSGVLTSIPVLWWVFRCRNHYCLMSVGRWNVAGGTRSLERLLQWEQGPHRGIQDPQTPWRERQNCTIFRTGEIRATLVGGVFQFLCS